MEQAAAGVPDIPEDVELSGTNVSLVFHAEEFGSVHISCTFSLELLILRQFLQNCSALDSLCISKCSGVVNPDD